MDEYRVHMGRPGLKLFHQMAKSTCPVLRITRLLRAEVPHAGITGGGVPEFSAPSILPTEFLMNCAGMWPGAQDSATSPVVEMCSQHRKVLAWDSGLTRWFHFHLLSFDSQDNGAGLQGEAYHLSGSTGADFAFQGDS